MSSKLVELLKEIAPGVTRIALMFIPETAPSGGSRVAVLAARRAHSRPVRSGASAF